MENKKGYVTGKIAYNKKLTDKVYEMKVEGDFKGKPGQIYMVRAWDLDPLLSRPMSICDIENDGIVLLYLVVGKGTKIMSQLDKGDKISLLGPLGNGFSINEGGKVAIISGGIGIAPMKYLARSLEEKADLYAGFSDEAYFIDELKPYVNDLYITSDSGKSGVKGNVLTVFEDKGYDTIYACGPTPMLAAIKDQVKNTDDIQLSLEERMACGLGACMGCVVDTIHGHKKVCHDGPVMQAKEVIFDA